MMRPDAKIKKVYLYPKPVDSKRPANTPCTDQAGIHRCGSSRSISLARCVGSRVSTSLR